MSVLLVTAEARWGEVAADPGAAAALPTLPALAMLLHHGVPVVAPTNWRSGVLADLQWPAGERDLAAASVAAVAMPQIPQGASVCLVSPLHVVPGLSRVHLPPQGVLQLTGPEQAELMAAFHATFNATPLRAHADGGWVLEADFAAAAIDADPSELAGLALERGVSVQAELRALRRFGAEVEIWLATLPLNRAREARGDAPVNCLWFWGGGVKPALTHRPMALLCHDGGADLWWRGVASRAGTVPALAGQWQELPAGRVALLLQGRAENPGQLLQRWERNWFAPALAALQTKDISELRLRLGVRAWDVRYPRWPRRWRRVRPWWQLLAA